jgi:hypothetical protein
MPGKKCRVITNRGSSVMKYTRFTHLVPSLLGAGAMSLLAVGQLGAQGGFATGYADPMIMSEVNQMGGATPGTFGIDRARAVAGGQEDPFATQQGGFGDPNPSLDPFGAPQGGGFDQGFGQPGGFVEGGAFGPGGGAFGPGGFGPGAFAGQGQPQPFRPPPTVRAFFGERIVCPITGQLLADAVEVTVLADRAQLTYFDDGVTGGDFQAGDGIWTNVTSRGDQIAPEAGLVKTRMVRALEVSEALDPDQFHFEIRVASNDPLSNLPNMIELEELRDERLRDWAPQFLNRFRTNPAEPDPLNWEFREAHVPVPPMVPDIQLPPSFRPPVEGPFTLAEFEQFRQSQRPTGGSGGGSRASSGGSGGGGASSGGDAGGRP